MEENKKYRTHRYTIYFDSDCDVTEQEMIIHLYKAIQEELNKGGFMYCNLCVNERKEKIYKQQNANK